MYVYKRNRSVEKALWQIVYVSLKINFQKSKKLNQVNGFDGLRAYDIHVPQIVFKYFAVHRIIIVAVVVIVQKWFVIK